MSLRIGLSIMKVHLADISVSSSISSRNSSDFQKTVVGSQIVLSYDKYYEQH